MDSVPKLLTPSRPQLAAVCLLLLPGLCLLAGGCATGPVVAREMLADPTMRFSESRPIEPLGLSDPQADEPLPPDTVMTRLHVHADTGEQVKGTWLEYLIRAAIEIGGGFGVEAGYGLSHQDQLVQKLDGFAGPLGVVATRHGPDAALVLDDGTSIIRAGYRFRMAWNGHLHEPSIRARTSVLSRDTVVEVGYRRSMRSLTIDSEHLPAGDALDDDYSVDRLFAAIEQGFLPGWNLRLDLAMRVDSGFLQSPYRLVSLWSQHGGDTVPSGVPRTMPENHPGSRVRWGSMLRIRRMIESLAAAVELGLGYGAGSWRVEHSMLQAGWLQRLGDQFVLSAQGGAYHQTRASFYLDDYGSGPRGAYWSADASLSSYIAWWAQIGCSWTAFPERGRLLGMFKYLSVEAALRTSRAYYQWEGSGSNNGFTSYAWLASDERQPFGGGWLFGGWLGFEGGF